MGVLNNDLCLFLPRYIGVINHTDGWMDDFIYPDPPQKVETLDCGTTVMIML